MSTPTQEEYDQMILDCMNRESKMSEWERGFIQSVHEYTRDGGCLSQKQMAIVDRIWEKVT